MTVKELYLWAIENQCENKPMVLAYPDCDGYESYMSYESVEEAYEREDETRNWQKQVVVAPW